jgi:hypothetical protein
VCSQHPAFPAPRGAGRSRVAAQQAGVRQTATGQWQRQRPPPAAAATGTHRGLPGKQGRRGAHQPRPPIHQLRLACGGRCLQ